MECHVICNRALKEFFIHVFFFRTKVEQNFDYHQGLEPKQLCIPERRIIEYVLKNETLHNKNNILYCIT